MIRKTIDLSTVEFASYIQRIGARFVDMVIVSFIFSLYLTLVGVEIDQEASFKDLMSSNLGIGYMVWLLPLFYLAYEVPVVATRGQTIGKRIFGIGVVRTDGEIGIGLDRSINRILTLVICGIIPFIGVVALLWFVFDPKRQNVPDKAARTFVIRIPKDIDAHTVKPLVHQDPNDLDQESTSED